MIDKIEVGMKVRCTSLTPAFDLPRKLVGCLGTVIEDVKRSGYCLVAFVRPPSNTLQSWYVYPQHLSLPNDLMWEDKQRREAHAEKYL